MNLKDRIAQATGKATEIVRQHRGAIDSTIDKAGTLASSKTGGKYEEKIRQGSQGLRTGLDKLAPPRPSPTRNRARPAPKPETPLPTPARTPPPSPRSRTVSHLRRTSPGRARPARTHRPRKGECPCPPRPRPELTHPPT
ncbi:antitoxin [Humibacillus sp. DSM 29435]|uniref:antitoxin n=1 Tax=Humibacillus sp. DSM 29435 TaxID=1869167 RepID=UPI0009F4A530|nr:antitoxin [Humibacillus sp. DSM 29435]